MEYLAVVFFVLVTAICPTSAISGIDSVVIENGVVTVSGTGFGTGPNVRLFETFNEDGKVAGDVSTTTGPSVGAWDSVSASPLTYATEAKTGSYSGLIYASKVGKQNTLAFPDATEVFVSYWVKIPSGTCFPGTETENTLAGISAWKFVWVSDGQDGGTIPDDDLAIPTYVGYDSWMIAGNDYAYKYVTVPFVFSEWQRFSAYLKADPTNPSTVNGTTIFQTLSATNGLDQATYTDKPLFDGDDNAGDNSTFKWNHLNVPGWSATGYSCPQPRYDDIYVATGSNSARRIEIGDSSTYSNSTNLIVQPSTSWSDTSISSKLMLGDLSIGSTAYVYFIDADNSPSAGYPITVPGARRLSLAGSLIKLAEPGP